MCGATYPGVRGPAALVGIRAGDRITSIDGKAPGRLSSAATAALAHGPVGSTLAVDVSAGATVRHSTIMLRDLL